MASPLAIATVLVVLTLSPFPVGRAAAAAAPASPGPATPSAPDYRQFAMVHEGDAAHGRQLFEDPQGVACSKCHSIDGKGAKAGPDLFAAGDRLTRRELIESVMAPSARIAVGYGTTLVETRDGEQHLGILKQSSDAGVELALADGGRIRIRSADIREQRGTPLSLMPEGLQARLSPQDFTDLIEYLVTLKEPERSLTRRHGMPERLLPITPAAGLRPFLARDLTVAPLGSAAGTPVPSGLVWFAQVPGISNRFVALHQTGKIWLVEKRPEGDETSTFLDLTPQTFSLRGPNGLLGMAFHPGFQQNRKYYLKHQVLEQGRITTLVVERVASPDGRRDSGAAPRVLLRIPSVAEHHNGGCLQFGPDRLLYIGMGDSAPNFDPQGHGQDLHRLLGKMLRIDVDHPGEESPYRIPADNPFRGHPGAAPEIWAWGFREPWRFSFDPLTGELWVADLGQERGDEIEVVRRGQNYGWNVYEGFELFSTEHRREKVTYVPPLFSTRRRDGSCLIGGAVYRGDRKSSFYGVYIFGDHVSKRIWGLTRRAGRLETVRELAVAPQAITAIVPDEAGTLYVVGYGGMVYQLDLSGTRFDRRPVASARTP